LIKTLRTPRLITKQLRRIKRRRKRKRKKRRKRRKRTKRRRKRKKKRKMLLLSKCHLIFTLIQSATLLVALNIFIQSQNQAIQLITQFQTSEETLMLLLPSIALMLHRKLEITNGITMESSQSLKNQFSIMTVRSLMRILTILMHTWLLLRLN
jgi:hypothetical protein